MPSSLFRLNNGGAACRAGRPSRLVRWPERALPRPLSRLEFRDFGVSVSRRTRSVASATLIGVALALCGIYPPVLRAQQTPHVAFWTGNELFRACEPPKHPACWAYVTGVTDAFSMVESLMMKTGRLEKVLWCRPKGVTAEQVRDVVVQYLERNPQERHFSAPGLVLAALYQAFPCSQSK